VSDHKESGPEKAAAPGACRKVRRIMLPDPFTMHWTEAQIVELAKTFYRRSPVYCPMCVGNVVVDRIPLPTSGGASHLSLACHGCRRRGELAGFPETDGDEWTEPEREAILIGFQWHMPIICPRDKGVLDLNENEREPSRAGTGMRSLICPICSRRAAV
jgi:hypothetical protein